MNVNWLQLCSRLMLLLRTNYVFFYMQMVKLCGFDTYLYARSGQNFVHLENVLFKPPRLISMLISVRKAVYLPNLYVGTDKDKH